MAEEESDVPRLSDVALSGCACIGEPRTDETLYTKGRCCQGADLLECIHLRTACEEVAVVIFEQAHARVLEHTFLPHIV